MADSPPPLQLKDWFNEDRYRSLAAHTLPLCSRFNADTFLRCTLDGLESRSLLQRVHQTSLGFDAALPGTFRTKVATLRKIAPTVNHDFVAIFLADFVSTFGHDDPEFSLDALRFFTRFGSAEFAVRPFIAADPARTLATLLVWTQDPNEHVRRLASEGSRPRLPWGQRLHSLVKNPEPTAPILEALKCDDSLYVRRSVANHLNDITKDHPDWVLTRLEKWDLTDEKLRWIAKHACRTLIKRGHPRALALFGFGKKPAIDAQLSVTPGTLSLGQRLSIDTRITSTSHATQSLVIDYVVHYVKANGTTAPKVFKWKETELSAGQTLELRKTQILRDFTTRRHYPGHHPVSLQVNGQPVATTAFHLR